MARSARKLKLLLTKFAGRVTLARLGLWLLVAMLGLGQAIVWIEPLSAQLSVVEHLSMPLATLAALVLALAAILRAWPSAMAAGLLILTLSWPVFPRVAAPSIGGERLRVVSANLWHRAQIGADTLATLESSDADVIGLVELTKQGRQALAPLIERYPYRVDCFETEPRCETMLLSRLPIRQHFAGRIEGGMPIVAGAELQWGSRRFTILVTHLIWPFAPAGARPDFRPLASSFPESAQAEQAANLARLAGALSPDLVLMGDLNGVPWSRVGRAFRSATGLGNAASGTATWPAFLPWPLALPIDHVLARGHPVVVGFRALEATDSDHRPVEAEIAWRE